MGLLNLGKIQATLQVNPQPQLQAAEPGKQGFPKHQVRKRNALTLQELYVSTTTGEKRSEVSTRPGFLPYLAPGEHEHRQPLKPLAHGAGRPWGGAVTNAMCCCLPCNGCLALSVTCSLLGPEPSLLHWIPAGAFVSCSTYFLYIVLCSPAYTVVSKE